MENMLPLSGFFSIVCDNRDPLMSGGAMHEWILFIASQTVAVLTSGDHIVST